MRLSSLLSESVPRADFAGVYYHGTTGSYAPGRIKRRRERTHPSSVGVWFTSDPEVASAFAATGRDRQAAPRVVQAYLDIASPFVVESYGDYLEEWRRFGDSDSLRRSLLQRGYDSIVIMKSDTDVLRDRTRIDVAVLRDGMMSGLTGIETGTGTESVTESIEPQDVRLYHGTTTHALEKIKADGELRSPNFATIAEEVEEELGLSPGSVWNHQLYNFERGFRGPSDKMVYFTMSPKVANGYSFEAGGSEAYFDALQSAYYVMWPERGERVGDHEREPWITEQMRKFIGDPVILELEVPWEMIDENNLSMAWTENATIMLPSPVPAQYIVRVHREPLAEARHGWLDPHHGTGPWFHGTNHDFVPGDALLPGDETGKAHGQFSIGDRVWVSNDPRRAAAYGHLLYEVEPHTHPKAPHAYHDEHYTTGATVLRLVPWDEARNWCVREEYTRDELERMDIGDLDEMACGYRSGVVYDISVDQIHIRFPGDWEMAKDALKELRYYGDDGFGNYVIPKRAVSPRHWAKMYLKNEEPVVLSLMDDKFYLDDGHHRLLASQVLGRETIRAVIDIKDNPINKILGEDAGATDVGSVLRSVTETFLDRIRKQTGMPDTNAWDINTGWCEEWAVQAIKVLNGGEEDDNCYMAWVEEVDSGLDHNHIVLVYHGRYYDSQHPDGVDNVRDLSLVRGVGRDEWLGQDQD